MAAEDLTKVVRRPECPERLLEMPRPGAPVVEQFLPSEPHLMRRDAVGAQVFARNPIYGVPAVLDAWARHHSSLSSGSAFALRPVAVESWS